MMGAVTSMADAKPTFILLLPLFNLYFNNLLKANSPKMSVYITLNFIFISWISERYMLLCDTRFFYVQKYGGNPRTSTTFSLFIDQFARLQW